MTLIVLRTRGSSGARSPNRTRASASGLTISEACWELSWGGRFLIGTNPSSGEAASALNEMVLVVVKKAPLAGAVTAAVPAGRLPGLPKYLKKSESGFSRKRVSLLFNPFSYAVIER